MVYTNYCVACQKTNKNIILKESCTTKSYFCLTYIWVEKNKKKNIILLESCTIKSCFSYITFFTLTC